MPPAYRELLKGYDMSPIRYEHSIAAIAPRQLHGLHTGWPNPPSSETFFASLSAMNAVVFALDAESNDVVGYVCGMTDGILILYIWDLEVLPEYQNRDVESKLLQCLLEKHGNIYQVNANPHSGTQPYFEQEGFRSVDRSGSEYMTRMHLEWQNGGPNAVSSD